MSILTGDYDYRGSTDSRGRIRRVTYEAALTQSIKMWIASRRADMVGYPGRGGHVYDLLMMPMREVDSDDVESSIRHGFEVDYSPELEIYQLEVIADREQRQWIINAIFNSIELDYQIKFSEKIAGRR